MLIFFKSNIIALNCQLLSVRLRINSGYNDSHCGISRIGPGIWIFGKYVICKWRIEITDRVDLFIEFF